MNVKSKHKKTKQSHSYLRLGRTINIVLVWLILSHYFDSFSSGSVCAQELDDQLQTRSAGAFSAGQNQLSLGGGSSIIAETNYLILQGRYGHFILDGVMLESGLQAWIPLDGDAPSIYILSPGVTTYLYQLGSLVPYAGAFYQYAISELEFEDPSSLGARAGFLIRQARSNFGLGLRASQGISCGASCRRITPEISLFLSF
ncbi:MAG: hypothetical protein CMH49_05310 [Myxococcales bacterium]|nr:hypothetical protein [Myxococcales bacterium]